MYGGNYLRTMHDGHTAEECDRQTWEARSTTPFACCVAPVAFLTFTTPFEGGGRCHAMTSSVEGGKRCCVAPGSFALSRPAVLLD